jgi:dimethylargininase
MPARPPTRALVREPSPRYASAYLEHGVQVDQARARAQHAAYVRALSQSGLEIERVPAHPDLYDCVFIEDTAIVWGKRALITRMAPHREGEQGAVERHLFRTHEVVHPAAGARIDGGDVLHTETATYVGLTGRTNEAGARALETFLAPAGREVVRVPVTGVLHLKSAATYLGDGLLLAAPGTIDESLFGAGEVLRTAEGEPKAANALRIGRRLLTLAGYPGTEKRLREAARRRGLEVVVLEASEFEKGDGSLTCLSIIF